MVLFRTTCLDVLGLEQQQFTSATRVRKQAREKMLPIAVYPKTLMGTFTSVLKGNEVPTAISFGLQKSSTSLLLSWTYSHSETCLITSVNTTLNFFIWVEPLVLSTIPLTRKVCSCISATESDQRVSCAYPQTQQQEQHYAELTYVTENVFQRRRQGSRICSERQKPWMELFSSQAGSSAEIVQLMQLSFHPNPKLAGSELGKSKAKGKLYCPVLIPMLNCARGRTTSQVSRWLLQQTVVLLYCSVQ